MSGLIWANVESVTSEPFGVTWIRWYNDTDGAKIASADTGPYEAIPYGSHQTGEKHAAGKPPHPVHGQWQWGLACSRTARTIGLDGDYTGEWDSTATGKYLGHWQDVATSVRELEDGTFKFHVIMIVPPELLHLWPKQRVTKFGHIKSNGFTYVEGVHASGTSYVPTGHPWIVADEGLMQAMLEDNGGVLHTGTGTTSCDDFGADMKTWTDPDGGYPAHLAAEVLGNWTEGKRNDSLPARCGIIKAAGDRGITGMGTLFYELCGQYDAETGRGDNDVYRAYTTAHPAHEKVDAAAQDAMLAVVPGFNPGKRAARDAELRQLTSAVEGAEDQASPQPVTGPEWFFSRDEGLQAVTVARAVEKLGPLAVGADNRFWGYEHGVWTPAPHVVRDRTAKLLCERYRSGYARTIEDILSAHLSAGGWVVTAEPVERYVNVRNGLLDWRTGILHQHSPDVMSTVQLPVAWDQAAACPRFERWLAEVLPPDCVELAWELLAYLTFSGNPFHVAVMLTGTGRNGKGTFLRVAGALLGTRNITAVALHTLISNRFATASLFGKIANLAGDIDGRYLESTAVLKAVTGNDVITAEHKGRDAFDFTPWAVPVFSANKVPASADTSAGYLSRWLIVPFPHSFEGREDRAIEANLMAELPGILAAAVRRLPVVMARGRFALTDSAREAKADFERRVDQVRYWLHERADVTGNEHTNQATLYADYQRWIYTDGGKPLKAGEFYARLNAIGFVPAKVDGVRGYRGIVLRPQEPVVLMYPP